MVSSSEPSIEAWWSLLLAFVVLERPIIPERVLSLAKADRSRGMLSNRLLVIDGKFQCFVPGGVGSGVMLRLRCCCDTVCKKKMLAAEVSPGREHLLH